MKTVTISAKTKKYIGTIGLPEDSPLTIAAITKGFENVIVENTAPDIYELFQEEEVAYEVDNIQDALLALDAIFDDNED